jgi:hypothetical protein
MALRAELPAIRRIFPGLLAPQVLAHSRYRVRPAPNPGVPQFAAAARAPDAAVSTRPLAASRAGGASTSCRCRSPSLEAAFPKGCRSSRRRGCP